MPRNVRFSVFFCFALVALVLSPSIFSAHAIMLYVPAVMPGDMAQYKILYDSCQSSNPMVCQSMGSTLNDTAYAALQVVAVAPPVVTLQLITIYKNGTGSHEGVTVNVDTGYSNITSLGQGPPGDYFVLAGSLQFPDNIWNSPSAPTFNATTTESVLGQPRPVNFLNFSSTMDFGAVGSLSTKSGFAFDQASGVFIEISFEYTTTGLAGDTTIKFAIGMVDNNIWGTAILPDFGLSANPTTIPISGSATGTSTITLTRTYGYSAIVKLTATPSSSSITCSLSSSSLAVGGSDMSTLSCSGSSGTYTVSIDGNGGYSIHSTSVTVNIASSTTNPDFEISHSGPISFQTGGSGKATITITAQNGYSSTTTLEITNVPSGLSCSLDSNSLSYGYGSVTLTCSGQPGSYTVTIKASGGGTSHSTDTPVTVSAAPASTQPASGLPMPFIYAGIGVAAVAVAGLLAFLFLRKKPREDAVAPSEAPNPATQT